MIHVVHLKKERKIKMNKIIIIYDWANRPKKIIIDDVEKVSYYHVHIITGDEILTVYFKDGKSIRYNSCGGDDVRLKKYDDGEYNIDIDRIDEWNNYPSTIKDTLTQWSGISYKRYDKFCSEVCRVR